MSECIVLGILNTIGMIVNVAAATVLSVVSLRIMRDHKKNGS